jgi:hypothetical protein
MEVSVMSHKARRDLQCALALFLTAMLARGAVAPRVLADEDRPRRGSAPKVVLISLDGAKPDLIEHYLDTGVLPRDEGLGALRRRGVVARQNITATPSLTAVAHIAIATGSTAVNNDIPANTFHAVATPITGTISGFAAPIGGYDLTPLGPSATPSAEPLWVRLREVGKSVVTATWPGADGADILLNVSTTGTPNNVLVQGNDPVRLTDFTVPFGAFGGIGAQGFALTAADFGADPTVDAQLAAAGRSSFSPIRVTTAPFETFNCAPMVVTCPDLDDELVFLQGSPGTCAPTSVTCSDTTDADRPLKFEMRAALLDTTNDGVVNYDTVVFFDKTQGIPPGPFALPSTGPAYVQADGPSGRFYFEGTGNKIGAAYFVTSVAPDLSTVRFARSAANFIPRNGPVLDDVDDINTHVGFWAPSPDFRIPERLSPGFTSFPDLELEAMYEDQVQTFVRYQTQVAQRAIMQSSGADLVMMYIEQPDGSGHQFTLTDPRQASDFTNPASIGAGQDAAKVARYATYLEFAYQQANQAVAEIMATVGPAANVFVVSDHGMAPFHTAVNMPNLLRNAGVDLSTIAIRTTGPAVNIYVNQEIPRSLLRGYLVKGRA